MSEAQPPDRSPPKYGLAEQDRTPARTSTDGAGVSYGIEDEQGVDFRRYLAAVLRHKWVILILTVVGTAAGFVASQRVEPEYVAQTTVWIEQSNPRQTDAGPIRSEELLSSSAWVDLLRSFAVLDEVVRDEQLFLQPGEREDRPLLAGLTLQERFAPGQYRIRVDRAAGTYVLRDAGGAVVEQGAFGDSVGTELGLSWQPDLASFPDDRNVRFRIAMPRDRSLTLADNLQTRIDQTGNFLRVELHGSDPEKTASILNTLTDRYVDVARDLKRAKIDELVTILDEQLAYAERNLREAEVALEDFRTETITLPSERSTPIAPGISMTQDPVLENFFSMRVELEQIRRDRRGIERAVQSPEGASVEALGSIEPVQRSSELTGALGELTEKRAELRALRYQYTDEHPTVRQLLDEIETLEKETIPRLGRELLSELATRQNQLEQSVAEASGDIRQIPPRAIEEARLERRVEIADNLYTTLQTRYEEARLAAASSIPDVRVLDEATVPQRPLGDPNLMLILMAFAGSLGLGVLGAILRDRFDPRLRYADQVTREMGLSILGSVPNLRKKVDTKQATEVLESFRTIRLNVVHAYGAAGPLTLTISSPGEGDGKSFVAANLALAFAELGHRTLLVDGDIRRGTLHKLLTTDRKPGLTDFLDGRIDREHLVRSTSFERLHLLPSGSRVSHGPELLGSAEMRELLLGLRNDYDVILVDSSPLGAGVDPFALGTLTGNMLVVLRSGTTNKDMAESKLEILDRLPVRLVGAVFNGVPSRKGYGYYGYISGYAAEDEREPLQVEAGT